MNDPFRPSEADVPAADRPTQETTGQHGRSSAGDGVRRRRLRLRRAACAVALFAGLGAAGLAGGHVLGAVAGHGAAEHGFHGEHGPGDDDGGLIGRPLPGPVAPPAPGR